MLTFCALGTFHAVTVYVYCEKAVVLRNNIIWMNKYAAQNKNHQALLYDRIISAALLLLADWLSLSPEDGIR